MPGNYPKEVILKDGRPIMLRPLQKADLDLLKDFFRCIPQEDRWFLNHDIGDPDVPAYFIEHLNFDRVFPIVALDQGRMVANATLHRRNFGWRSHIGELRILVEPEYRNKRLGT